MYGLFLWSTEMAMVMGGVNFQGYYFCMQNDVDFTAQTYKASIAAQCEHSTISGTSAGTDTWYDLNGRRLQGRPTRKGIYLRNGKKTVY